MTTKVPLQDNQGRIIGLVGIGKDITERKQAEETLKNLNENLEKMVEQRTAQLQAVQHELVENAHKAGMADIASNILHNIGNVLNSIYTSSQNIQNILKKSKLNSYLKATDLLSQNLGNIESFITHNPKGKRILEYFIALGRNFKHEHTELDRDIERINEKVKIVEHIVNSQQNYIFTGTYDESILLERIIEDILKNHQITFEEKSIQIKKEVPKNITIIGN